MAMTGTHDLEGPRRTKIVATLGPASANDEVLEGLIRAGVDVTRFNFSHGSHEDHQRAYDRVRAAEARVGRPVAVLQDLQGPKIRLGKIDGVVELGAGERVVLSSANDFVGNRDRLPTTYERLSRDARPGEPVLLADAALELVVESVHGDDITCRVEVGGKLTSSKGMNLPRSTLTVPSVVPKDLADLEKGLAMGVDYVALSFVRAPHDVLQLREHMVRVGRVVPIIAKIEKPQAVERLEAITEVSDGLMVARGDLGVELPAEQVPAVQRQAIRLARVRGKVSIVATQMLVSMVRNPRPTYAEVSDVANAVFDGADAVMLSEETAAGGHPVRAVQTMAAILASADHAAKSEPEPFIPELRNSYPGAIARAAVSTARDMAASAIVTFTDWGLGPRLIGHWRPRCPIIGFASSDEAVRRMAAYWGVSPIQIPAPASVEALVAELERQEAERSLLPRGSTVVITTKMPFDEHQVTSVLKLHTIGGSFGGEPR
jgi:pyruvate kinase